MSVGTRPLLDLPDPNARKLARVSKPWLDFNHDVHKLRFRLSSEGEPLYLFLIYIPRIWSGFVISAMPAIPDY